MRRDFAAIKARLSAPGAPALVVAHYGCRRCGLILRTRGAPTRGPRCLHCGHPTIRLAEELP